MPKQRIRPWLEKQREALRKSIKQKWTRLASGKSRGTGEPLCALCRAAKDDCRDCLIGIITGANNCRGTPHSAWSDSLDAELTSYTRALNAPPVVRAAKKMLAWLKALDAELSELLDGPAPKRSRKGKRT